MAKLTHNQRLLLETLDEHAKAGGEAIGNSEIDTELNRRHNRHMGYDMIHGALKRMEKRGMVHRTAHKPIRWQITDAGRAALTA